MKYKVLKEFLYAFEDEVAKHATLDDIVDLSPYQSGSYLVDLLAYGFIEEYKPDLGRLRPELYGEYYHIGSDGGIAYILNKNLPEDLYRIDMGNCYKTEEEAQRARDTILLKQEIKDFAFEYNDGWVADWDNGSQGKYFYVYGGESQSWEADYNFSYYLPDAIYFKDENFFKPLLEKFGARMDLLKPEAK